MQQPSCSGARRDFFLNGLIIDYPAAAQPVITTAITGRLDPSTDTRVINCESSPTYEESVE